MQKWMEGHGYFSSDIDEHTLKRLQMTYMQNWTASQRQAYMQWYWQGKHFHEPGHFRPQFGVAEQRPGSIPQVWYNVNEVHNTFLPAGVICICRVIPAQTSQPLMAWTCMRQALGKWLVQCRCRNCPSNTASYLYRDGRCLFRRGCRTLIMCRTRDTHCRQVWPPTTIISFMTNPTRRSIAAWKVNRLPTTDVSFFTVISVSVWLLDWSKFYISYSQRAGSRKSHPSSSSCRTTARASWSDIPSCKTWRRQCPS